MKTKFIEAVTKTDSNAKNWGKFMLARFDEDEWNRQSTVGSHALLREVGWAPLHLMVFDLQTGEGAIFKPHGSAHADLEKHAVWVCPMFEPFLTWLYTQDVTNIELLPSYVEIEGEFMLSGYRRPGPKACKTGKSRSK